jgi:signal peptidase I
MTRRTATRAVAATVQVALLTAGWLFFAPAQLGGSTRYAIVEGSSMAPHLSDGDLAVVRSSDEVDVGDVVLYEEPDLRVGVLHRVVRLDGERLVLKGDANDFLDDRHPTAAEVEGSLWFSIPYAGFGLGWIRTPLHAALLVFALTFVALTGGRARRDPKGETSCA